MKREIICNKCRDDLLGSLGEYPGEHYKWEQGKSLKDLVCDNCGNPIPQGVLCYALSIWADYGGAPYYPWEYEYLEK